MGKGNGLAVLKRSNTGLGLFAAAEIAKGTKIIQYVGKRIRNDDAENHKGRYLFTLDEKYTIDGSDRRNLARYVNHSCRPNADSDVIKSEIWIIARRKIKESEEITINYGKDYFNQFIKPKGCRCDKCSVQNPSKKP